MENKNVSTYETAQKDAIDKQRLKLFFAITACVIVIMLIMTCCDPIVLTVRYDDPEIVGGSEHWDAEGKVITFYADESGTYYYLTDGTDAYDYTVIYLFGASETLPDALREGHISFSDLERFGLEYGSIQQ